MPQFWPFQPPEAPPEKIGFLGPIIDWFVEFIDAVYYAGVIHGALVASIVWIAIVIVIIIVAILLHYKKQRELTVGLVGILVALLLWYANRLPAVNSRPSVPSIPVKPDPPRPRLPWRTALSEGIDK